MELLKDKIKKEGRVTEDNILMVDSFLNHQMDVEFFNEVGKEFKDRFKNDQIDKILTRINRNRIRNNNCSILW